MVVSCAAKSEVGHHDEPEWDAHVRESLPSSDDTEQGARWDSLLPSRILPGFCGVLAPTGDQTSSPLA